MKTICLYSLLALLPLVPVAADEVKRLPGGAEVSGVDIRKQRDSVVIRMNLNLNGMEVGRNRSIVVTPLFYAEGEEEWLPAIEVMGRTRYLYYQRNEESLYADSPYTIIKKDKNATQQVGYQVSVPYRKWMDRASLVVAEDTCQCGEVSKGNSILLAQADLVFTPRLAYISPQAETRKARALSGEAYLDFPVNKTVIYPEYRRNTAELAKIRATIDTIRTDKDFSITRISLKGYASPEGRYAANVRLSEGRTDALKDYLMGEYGFEASLFRTNAGAENWEGLRKYVAQSGLADKEAILAIIDSEEEPDAKEQRIRREHAASYHILLQDCYPALRRTDYTVDYVIRGFNVEEAKEVIKTRPQNLSLQEMFAVAQTYQPGSEEFNHVFDVAVRLYPADPIANLNAANALLERKEAAQALKFLDKAGDTPQADNARGVAMILLERYDEAERYLRRAAQAGVSEASENLKYIR
ncbi:DUF3868 domain-containing protein [Phocaeicola sp. Sa1CVN1]|uniref:DUF3868 domain-containing protein n=1 Tax=Phocaeicola intestinalis TaxID=2762212 RepID=A0ABR8YCR2_9BACT|nr:DUF3868 domain-containing protein [Phocaeicola intestinalis]MBD8041922.1 DUF3868 domain-containing protein [Phocaeicola intestinalis]